MQFGTHVSAAGGLDKTFQRTTDVGADCFQCFSRPPQGGKAPEITKEIAENFKKEQKRTGIKDFFIHTPYFINLASAVAKNRKYSSLVIREDLDRGSLLGFKYVNTHIGSSGEDSQEVGLPRVIKGLKDVLKNYKGSTGLLIEISAGSGNIIGASFEQIGLILKGVDEEYPGALNVCFDTAHAFASGYDLRSVEVVKKTMGDFDKLVGFERLKLIHANDSKVDLGERKDRHEHIGKGKIGAKGFKAFIKFLEATPRLRDLSLILETPKDSPEDDPRNLQILRSLVE